MGNIRKTKVKTRKKKKKRTTMFLHTLRRVLQENPDLWNCWGKKKSRKRTKAGVEIGKGKRSLREMKTSAVSARLVLGCKNSTCAGPMLLAACILFLGRDICEYASTMCCRRIFIFIVYKVQVLLLASAVYCCCCFFLLRPLLPLFLYCSGTIEA